jgi:hypothetical protein
MLSQADCNVSEQNQVTWCAMAYEMKAYLFCCEALFCENISGFSFIVWKPWKTDLYFACF